MPWIVGIDEAGYGPNLGPFIMSAVACRVPDDQANADLWHVLRSAVRRAGEPDDGRILIADSKLVYSTTRGLLGLETGVLAACPACPAGQPKPLRHYLDRLSPTAALAGETWYTGDSLLPVVAAPTDCATAAQRLAETSREQAVQWGRVRSVVVRPAAFNALLDCSGSKGAVLGHALAELLRSQLDGDEAEPLAFVIDKHGGRNNYAALLQDAVPAGMVIVLHESAARSSYRLLGLKREVLLTFQPRADAEHFCVAVASMVSKYLREVLMREFNAFWAQHVPGVKPTAGYPTDAARFYKAIRPAMERLKLTATEVWRRK